MATTDNQRKDETMGQLALLRTRRFGPLFTTQLLGALNDNVLRTAAVVSLTLGAGSWGGMSADTLVNVTTALFVAPFFLFSSIAGLLADKYDKARLVRAVKVLEIGIVLLASVGFATRSAAILFGALFLLGTHSAFFGPVKYSILPQHLRPEELVSGNALVQLATFVAIVVGTMAGGALAGTGPLAVSATIVALAVAGFATSRAVPPAPAPVPDLRLHWRPLADARETLGLLRETRSVLLSILGISWFWLYGAVLLGELPALGSEALGGDARVITILLTVFAVGTAIGCLLCERLSGGTIELGLVPIGSLGLTVFAVDLCLAAGAADGRLGTPASWRFLADLALIGVFGGLYIVPLQAFVQHRVDPRRCARILAGSSILSALFTVIGALAAIGLRAAGLSILQVLLVLAAANAGVAIYIYTVVPEFVVRFIIWMLVHTVYRLRKRGLEHLPAEGPAVLVCNHVTFVDALVIAAACRRPVRFIMHHTYYRLPVLSFIFRVGRAIPIGSRREQPKLTEDAFDEVARGLEAGDVVCIFPEGALTKTGEVNRFRVGIERIVARTPVPVIPLALRGLWGSFFSRSGGRAMLKLPRRFWSRIELVCGAPVPAAEVSAARLQACVLALRGSWR
jgi:1-acyl-sn-glycerol-3-phosphate acyltransferase